MKGRDKKPVVVLSVPAPEPVAPDKKESSGDKKFDDAIDRLFKKPLVLAPSK